MAGFFGGRVPQHLPPTWQLPPEPKPDLPKSVDLDGINIKRRARGLPNLSARDVRTAMASAPADAGPDFTGFLVGYVTGIPISPAGIIGSMLHPSGAAASSSGYSDSPGDTQSSLSSDSGSSSSSYDSGSSGGSDSGSSSSGGGDY